MVSTTTIANSQRVTHNRLTSSGAFEHDLVVETESQFGHAREVALHLDRAKNLAPDNVAVCIDLSRDGKEGQPLVSRDRGGTWRRDGPAS